MRVLALGFRVFSSVGPALKGLELKVASGNQDDRFLMVEDLGVIT